MAGGFGVTTMTAAAAAGAAMAGDFLADSEDQAVPPAAGTVSPTSHAEDGGASELRGGSRVTPLLPPPVDRFDGAVFGAFTGTAHDLPSKAVAADDGNSAAQAAAPAPTPAPGPVSAAAGASADEGGGDPRAAHLGEVIAC